MTPARWLVLTGRVPSEELSSELSEGFLALGGTAVEIVGDRMTTYVPEPARLEDFLEGARRRLGHALGEGGLEWRWQEEEDWAATWKQGLEPRAIGRVTVTQPWNPIPERDEAVVVVIDPGSAFGTGEHATTRGALRLLQGEVREGARVLDVGSGSGILSIVAVRLGAERVLAVEVDAGAIGSARANLDRNGVSDRVELVCQRVDLPYLGGLTPGEFDLIAANVLSGILVPLLPGFARLLEPGARFILGGVLDSEVADVVGAAHEVGLDLISEDREAEWWTGLFHRPVRGPVP